MVEFDRAASAAIQSVFDDPSLGQLGDRLEVVVDQLHAGPPYSDRVRGRLMQTSRLWYVAVYGDRRRFALLWDEVDDGVARVHWAGPAI